MHESKSPFDESIVRVQHLSFIATVNPSTGLNILDIMMVQIFSFGAHSGSQSLRHLV
jgi:hypothetical protein